MKTHSTIAGLMMTAAWIIPGSAWAETCTATDLECAANAQTVVSMPVGANAEAAATAPKAQGFAISVNGATP